jgi:hypothetical protein
VRQLKRSILLMMLLQPAALCQYVLPTQHKFNALTAAAAAATLCLCCCRQVRTFSRDELRSLFRVDPTTPCDTHKAIKCSCSGSLEDLDFCKERAAAAAAAAAEGGGGEAEQQGVLGWAHLARAMDSPDPTWQVSRDESRQELLVCRL